MEVRIKVIPFVVASALAAGLWWMRPSQASFAPFFQKWVRERVSGPTNNKPEEGFWAKVGDTLTRIRDKALEGVIENAVDIQHVDLLLARLTRVYLEDKVLTFIGVCGIWANITPPDSDFKPNK